MGFFNDVSRAIGTDKDTAALGSIGKSIGLDNDTIAALRIPALAAGAYFGAPYLMNAIGGGGAASGAAASGAEALSAADIAGGMIPEFGTNAAYSGFMDGAIGSGLAGTGAGFVDNALGQSLTQGGSSLWNTVKDGAGKVVDLAGGAGNLGAIAGGLLGAAASGDTTTSTNRDPWGPAQGYLKDNLATNANMQKYYQANPFSQEQQSAYQGLLNTNANNQANAPIMQANANSFMQSKRGAMPQMQGLLSGTQAAPIDWSKYANIGKG